MQSREKVEGRKVPEKVFIRQFLQSQQVVNQLKVDFGKSLKVDLLFKNIDGSLKSYHANVDNIHNYLKERFTEDDLRQIVKLSGD